MQLPFTHDAFLDVFGRYNLLLWPAALGLWVVTGLVVVLWREGRASARPLFAVLALHWGWSGVAYHWFFFREINPAATVFAGLFVFQGACFGWLAWRTGRAAFAGTGPRGVIGGALVMYGMVYPVLGLGFGLAYPRVPLFAVPCPTTLITAGVLVTSVDVPRLANIVPIAWAVIGSSAAFVLGIRADLALAVAAAALALDTVAPRSLGARPVV